MDGLRGIIAIAGILIIALVYGITVQQQRRRKRESQESHERVEPSWDEADASEEVDDAMYVEESSEPDYDAGIEPDADAALPPIEPADLDPELPLEHPEPVIDKPEKIVAIRLVAKNGEHFVGEELVLTMRGLGLQHGKFGIFHHHDGEGDDPVFSVANLLEPGSFDLANIKDQEFPGVSFFMVLPGPLGGAAAFDAMVLTARTMSKTLAGEILDANGSSFSIQRERFIREEIIQYEHGVAFG